jgi:hypothetical protein
MGMDAYIYVNGESFDAYKGRYTYYWLESNDPGESKGEKLKIRYKAEGGYGRVKCGIKIGFKDGTTFSEYISGYNPHEDRYGAKFTIPALDEVLIVMVFIDSNYGYVDDFDGQFKRELALHQERLPKGSDDDEGSDDEENEMEFALHEETMV